MSSDDHYEVCHFCQTTCLEYSWHKRVKRVDPIPTPVDIQNLEQNFGNVEQILLPVEDGPELVGMTSNIANNMCLQPLRIIDTVVNRIPKVRPSFRMQRVASTDGHVQIHPYVQMSLTALTASAQV